MSTVAAAAASPMDALIREPADVYHSRRRDYLSSHALADFRKCPELFHRKQLGLIEDKDRPAYAIGRAAHTLILEGCDAFEAEYAVGGPINPRTGQPFGTGTKAFQDWVDASGKAGISAEDADFVERLERSVRAHAIAAMLLRGGRAEGVCRVDYHGVPSQSRLDYFHGAHGIVDLKTCDDLTWFEADARRYGYLHQVAFYRAVMAAATGEVMPVHIVAVEKREPFRTGVWRVAESPLDFAQAENEAAIERLKDCQANGIWPSGYESLRIFDSV